MTQNNLDSSAELSLANDSVIDLSSDSDNEASLKVSSTTTGGASFLQRLFNCDKRRFTKYIQSSSVHGVAHIFVGKSKIRRFLWLLILLSAGVGCAYNIIDRITFLAGEPTATKTSIVELESVDFPAVTLCNLNLIKKSYVKDVSPEVVKLLQKSLYDQRTIIDEKCNGRLKSTEENKTYYHQKSIPDILWYGRHTAEETIFSCQFIDQECNASDFTPTFTSSGGVCYTFNSGKHATVLRTNGAGTRFALTLVMYVLQHDYNVGHNYNAGIKIAVHPQNEPPQPDELGIAVPPGKNAFISMRQTNIENRSSRRKCRDTSDTTSLNFLQGEYPYSVSACQTDCIRTNIAQSCKCLGAGMTLSTKSKFHNLDNCTIAVKDICCLANEISRPSACDCGKACKRTYYDTAISYSAFPAKYAEEDLAITVNHRYNITANATFLHDNFIGINIYFETLTIAEEITINAYDVIALLSDIGGQLALFLGASVVSAFEFVMWCFDEIKDRCFGIDERKIRSKFKAGVLKTVTSMRSKQVKECVVYSANHECIQIENYTNFESM